MVQSLIHKMEQWTRKERELLADYMAINPMENKELADTAYARALEGKAQLLRALEAWDFLQGNHAGWPNERWIQLPRTHAHPDERPHYWHKIANQAERSCLEKCIPQAAEKRGEHRCHEHQAI